MIEIESLRAPKFKKIIARHLLHTPRIVYVDSPTGPSVGGVTLTVKQTVKQFVPIDMNTEIPKLLLSMYFGCLWCICKAFNCISPAP